MNAPADRPLHRRIIDTFVAPRRLFAGLNELPPWFDVLAISTAAAIAAAILIPDDFFISQLENPLDRRGRPVVVTSSPETIAHYGRYLAMMSALVGHPIVAFSLAGILSVLFSIIGRGRARYPQYLAVVAHALLVPALGTVLLLAARALGSTLSSFHLALLAPGLQRGGLALRLLAGIDPFVIWMLVISAIGVAELDGRRRWGTVAALLIGLYLLFDVSTALFIA